MGIVVNRTRLNPFPVKSASGEFISIDDAVNRPVKKLEISFTPQQDLHGYSYPWVGGSGINIANPDEFESGKRLDNVGNVISYANCAVSGWIPVSENTDYCIRNAINSSSGYAMCIYDENKEFLRYQVISGTSPVNGVRNTGADAAYARFTFMLSTIDQSMVAKSSSVVAFQPYANICPITGYTECYLAKSNQNLLPSSTPSNVIAGTHSGGVIGSATNTRVCAVPVPKNMTICGQKLQSDRNTGNLARADTGNIKVGTTIYSSYGLTNATAQNINTLTHPWLTIESSPRAKLDEFFTESRQLMVSIGSGRKTYVAPSQDYQLIQVNWQTEAGEVFGGTLDLVHGVLSADRVKKTFNGNEAITRDGGNNATSYFVYKVGARGRVAGSNEDICSIWEYASITSSTTVIGFRVYNSAGYNSAVIGFRPVGAYVDGVRMTTTQCKQMLADLYSAGTPCEVVYKLAEPITYQLSPHQISTLMGSNRIWTDVGTISLDYRAMRSAQNTPLLGMLGNPSVPEELIEEVEE